MENSKVPLIVSFVVSIALVLGLIVFASGEAVPEERVNELLADERISKGQTEDPKVIVTEFADFECPGCANFDPILQAAAEKYGDDVLIQYKHFPLVSIHRNARAAGYAAEAAHNQGLFWEYGSILYQNQAVWSELDGEELEAQFLTYAEEVGIEDLDQFKADYDSDEVRDRVASDLDDAQELGLNSTPTVFIDNDQLSSTQLANLDQLIQDALDEN